MAGLPSKARVVVIGAGIVGNSMAWHLARLGWRDIVLLEKGSLPSPGGSTGHASNFIYLTDHSKEMTAFTLDSVRQYEELGVFTMTGGIEVARTPERMQELTRRITSSKSWGIEPAELVSSERVKELVPFINSDIVLGGVYWPKVGVVDSLEAGTLMRKKAQELGALTIAAGVEVTGIDTKNGRVTGVRTDHGDIATDTVVIACGVWSPRIAAMAGASIPLTPAVHQMIDIGPVAIFEDVPVAVGYPIIRDVDTNMYERQHGNEFEVGSYAHRPILMDADDIPSISQAALSPTMLPFTQDDFDPQLEDALELFPEVMGDEKAGVKLAINGLLSLTPDGNPIIGETPEVKGLWSAAAIWIKEAPGIARCVAEWMTERRAGDRPARLRHRPVLRPPQDREAHRRAHDRGLQQDLRHRPPDGAVGLQPRCAALAVLRAREGAAAPSSMRPPAGSARTSTASNEPLLEEYGDRVMPRAAEWESRWWSPIINAEHLAMRDRAGLVDLSAFAIFDVTGPDAAAYLERLCVNKVDVPVGRTVYTPLLNGAGGILADLTIMRLAWDHFRVVTGGGMGMRDKKIFTDALPADGSAQLFDATNSFTTIGLWGPRARDILAGVTSNDVSHTGFPFLTSKTIEINGVRALASRISYVGELGWEIYLPMEQGLRVWDALWESGAPHGMVPVGIGTYAVTARLEKGYRAHGNELELDFNLVEAGMARPTVKEADFVGKDAYLGQRSAPPAAVLCTLTLDDPTSKSGVERYMLGREPILSRAGGAARGCPRAAVVRDLGRLGAVGGQAPADVVLAAVGSSRRQPASG